MEHELQLQFPCLLPEAFRRFSPSASLARKIVANVASDTVLIARCEVIFLLFLSETRLQQTPRQQIL